MTRARRIVTVFSLLALPLAGGAVWWALVRQANLNLGSSIRWQAGEYSAFRLNLRARVSSGDSAGAIDLDLVGDLNVRPEGISEGVALEVWVSDPVAHNVATQSLAEALRTKVFLQFNTNGAFAGVRAPAQVPPFAVNVWQSIGAAMQASGRQEGAIQWKATEMDSIGIYEALYKVDAGSLTRRKQTYLKAHQPQASYAIAGSSSTMAISKSLALEALHSKEMVRLSFGELLSLTSDTSIALVLNQANGGRGVGC